MPLSEARSSASRICAFCPGAANMSTISRGAHAPRIVRSPVAHGRIRTIDGGGVGAPGVHAVITATDIGLVIPTIPLRHEAPALDNYAAGDRAG